MYAFCPGGEKVTRRTNLAFVPKLSDPCGSIRVVDLQAFHPPPFLSAKYEWLHCLCLLCALCMYVKEQEHFGLAMSFLSLGLIRTKGNPSHVNTFPTG